MKRELLEQIGAKLNSYKKIFAVERVADNTLKITFDKEHTYYFDMKRGEAHIFKCDALKRAKIYQAPFDLVLKKRFTNSFVEEVKLHPRDNLLQIVANHHSKYKETSTILQFEFTGRYTNIIILDDKGIVLEALRHIDKSNSFREVKVGVKLLELPPKETKHKASTNLMIEDIDAYLYEEHTKREKAKLENLKKSKISAIDKKIKKFKKILSSLEDRESLQKKAQKYEMQGNIILSNLHKLQNYQTKVKVMDFEGREVEISLPPQANTPAMAADMLFKKAKKFKQKANSLIIEKENLESKIRFLEHLKETVNSAKSSDEVELLVPKQKRGEKRDKNDDSNIEHFFISDYKISLGKNEKGNIKLLKSAKMSDIWMHLKDIPSTHVIITNTKKSPPPEVLEFGAKLCVNFSTTQKGRYLVDYTHRRDVKVVQGAKVEYKNFKTISVNKE